VAIDAFRIAARLKGNIARKAIRRGGYGHANEKG
jgi:hypothetical protein